MKHFIKDMKLALIEANRKGLSLDVLSMVLANYEELEQEGYGDLGTQALMKSTMKNIGTWTSKKSVNDNRKNSVKNQQNRLR